LLLAIREIGVILNDCEGAQNKVPQMKFSGNQFPFCALAIIAQTTFFLNAAECFGRTPFAFSCSMLTWLDSPLS